MLRALGAALLLLAAVSAKAALVDVSIDDKLFGRLDQHDIESVRIRRAGPQPPSTLLYSFKICIRGLTAPIWWAIRTNI